MKKNGFFRVACFIEVLLLSWQVEAACRNPNIAQGDYVLRPAAASGLIEIKWFGHSFFQITSRGGTKIITDPFGAMGFPMPEVWPHVVTVGKETGNHSNVGLAKGNPIILRGLKERAEDWNQKSTHPFTACRPRNDVQVRGGTVGAGPRSHPGQSRSQDFTVVRWKILLPCPMTNWNSF